MFIALHFYFICQLSKFLLLFLCQSAKFISKFRSYAQSRNWITKKVKFLYLLFVSSFFQLLYAHVQGYEGRRQMAVCEDAWQRKDSTIKHPRSVKIPANQFVWFSVIYQLCVCNIFIRFVPIRIRFQFLMFVWVVSYFFVIINRFCLIIIIGKEKLCAI